MGQGDIAIDDLDFNSPVDPCMYIPPDAQPPGPTIPVPVPPEAMNCDFEDGTLCKWTSQKIQWERILFSNLLP